MKFGCVGLVEAASKNVVPIFLLCPAVSLTMRSAIMESGEFLPEIARHDGRGVYRAKSRNVSETRARMRSRSRSRPLPPPAPGFQLSSRGDGVPDQAATRSGGQAAQYPPPCGRSEPEPRAKHALPPQAHPASTDARELSTWR